MLSRKPKIGEEIVGEDGKHVGTVIGFKIPGPALETRGYIADDNLSDRCSLCVLKQKHRVWHYDFNGFLDNDPNRSGSYNDDAFIWIMDDGSLNPLFTIKE
jgi:hypothetical protein